MRSTSRPTPFGLFAASSTVGIGKRTDLRVDELDDRKTTRIDLGLLEDQAERIARAPQFREQITLRANPTLRRVGDRFHLGVVDRASGLRPVETISIEARPVLDAILGLARSGVLWADLRSELRERSPAFDSSQLDAQIEGLIESQFLEPDFGPSIGSSDPLAGLVERIASMTEGEAIADRLRRLRDRLRHNDLGIAPPESYRRIQTDFGLTKTPAEGLRGEGRNDSLSGGSRSTSAFQVDLRRSAPGAEIDSQLVGEAIAAVEWLNQAMPSPPDPLAELAAHFASRFGADEVPLEIVFDEEYGIGFDDASGAEAVPLIGDRVRNQVSGTNGSEIALPHAIETALDRLAAWRSSVLDLAGVSNEGDRSAAPLPLSGALKGSVIRDFETTSGARVEGFHLHAFMGRPGTSLLGRAAVDDPELLAALRRHCDEEQVLAGEAIVAEIGHRPGGAAAHLFRRPVLSPWQIACAGPTEVAGGQRLEIADLRVRLLDGRFILRSASLDRRVLPRSNAAHDYRRAASPIYRFLGELQQHAVDSWLAWSWGDRSSAPCLPRVTLGRIVLARRRASIDSATLRRWSRHDLRARIEAVDRWRGEVGLPRWGVWVDGDRELTIDFENPLMVDAFIALAARGPAAVVEEMLPAPHQLAVQGRRGRFVHDLVIPVLRTRSLAPIAPEVGSRQNTSSARRQDRADLPIGEPWLQLDVYSGPATADRVLRERFTAMTSQPFESVSRRFFVRYSDPHAHLRIRLRNETGWRREEIEEIVDLVRTWRSELGLWEIEARRHEPEVERYGGAAAIPSAERIFHADSEAVVEILRGRVDPDEAGQRWKAALFGVDRLLDDFDLTLKEKSVAVGGLAGAFGPTLWHSRETRRRFDRQYRRDREEIESWIRGVADDPACGRAAEALAARSRTLREVVPEWLTASAVEKLGSDLGSAAEHPIQAFVHMHCNRLLRWPSRLQEAALYEILHRTYRSRLARVSNPAAGKVRSSLQDPR